MSLVLRGRLDEFRGLLEGADPASLSAGERAIADRFRQRFLEGTDPGPEPEDPFIAGVLSAYRAYWQEALLGRVSGEEADRFLKDRLEDLLPTAAAGASDSSDVFARIGDGLDRSGVHFLDLHGKTLPFYEFMAWASEDTTQFDVQLTDRLQPVTVVFMRDFLVKGWAEWATFGHASTGGWAGSDALFCLGDDYDPESERFLVSYLRHEARHFADYDLYPELGQVDLEYRAKLTELVYADTTVGNLLAHFAGQASPDPAAPHAFASHAVVADLRAWRPDDPAMWPREELRAAARALLARHDEALLAAGAGTTEGVIVGRAGVPTDTAN
jgi:hypothetical protein